MNRNIPKTPDTEIPVVAYASKSTKDDHDSVPDQLATVDLAVDREGGRFVFAGPFHEEKRSGWKQDRGAELEAALAAAEAAADQYGAAELWVWKSERLGRGSGKRDEARSLLEVYTRLKRAGVTLRSVLDDDYVQDEGMIGMASKMANKYSEDLSAAVKAGKQRQRERGEIHGGVVPEGYTDKWDTHPTEQEGMARSFALGLSGMAPEPAAKTLNAEGFRTRSGKPWERRSVEDKWMNAVYAGAVVYFRGEANEEIRWDLADHHPAYITRAEFEQLAQMRSGRDRAKGTNRAGHGGREHQRHFLAGLALCACGETMRPRTSSYKRKSDGQKAYSYMCAHVHGGTGLCDAPVVNGEQLDAAILAHLDGLFIDADGFIEQQTQGRVRERDGIEADREKASARLGELRRREVKIRERLAAKLADGDDATATVLEETLAQQRTEAGQVESRVAELDELLAAPAEADPVDRVLDFWNDLRENVRGVLDRNRIPEVRAGLAEIFEAFVIETTGEGIAVQPVLRSDAAAILVEHLDAERPTSNDPAEWAAFYAANRPRTASVATAENEGLAPCIPLLLDPDATARSTQL